MSSKGKLRVAWFSPLINDAPQTYSSTAAYVTNCLYPYLKDQIEIDLFHQQSSPDASSNVYHFLTAIERHQEQPYDLFFYQIEDTAVCDFVRLHLSLVPGIVLFHDVLFRAEESPSSVVQMQKQSLALLEVFGVSLEQAANRESHFLHQEQSLSLLSLFSSERNMAEFRRHLSSSVLLEESERQKIFYLPYPVDSAPDFSQKAAEEQGRIPRIAALGSPNVEHRMHYVLSALSQLSQEVTLVWLLEPEEEQAARRLCAEFSLNHVEIICSRSFAGWSRVLEEADAAVHTLFGAYGDPGPWLAMSLTAGKPCVVSDCSAAANLPDSIVHKTRVGQGETEDLQQFFEAFVGNPCQREEIDARAQRGALYALEQHSTQMIAQELKWVFEQAAEDVSQFTERWFDVHAERLSEIIEDSRLLCLNNNP